MKAKRVISLLLILMLALSLCACKDEEKPTDDPLPPEDDTKTYTDTLKYVIPDGTGTLTATGDLGGRYYEIANTDRTVLKNVSNELKFIRAELFENEETIIIAPTFIDKTVKKFDNLEFIGTVQIGQNGEYAEMVSGYDDTQYVEAYLLDTDGGVLAITISSVANDDSLAALRSMVENFVIEHN